MPWLVVEGSDSTFTLTHGRKWVDNPHRQPPVDGPKDENGKGLPGSWEYSVRRFRAIDSPHAISDDEAEMILKQYPEAFPSWLHMFEDDALPGLRHIEAPSGELTPEDVKEGTPAEGTFIEPEPVVESEPEPDEGPAMIHVCGSCDADDPRKFPSHAALERHIEFEHEGDRVIRTALEQRDAEERMQEAEELRRLEQAVDEVPPWEREAVEPVPE